MRYPGVGGVGDRPVKGVSYHSQDINVLGMRTSSQSNLVMGRKQLKLNMSNFLGKHSQPSTILGEKQDCVCH